MATIPANVGDPKDVPPATPAVEKALPGHEFPPTSVTQNRYPSCCGSAARAMSGTSRAPSLGTPVPVCQLGLENTMLAPPPPAESWLSKTVLFQVVSPMYDLAEPPLPLLAAFQKFDALAISPSKLAPPTDVT